MEIHETQTVIHAPPGGVMQFRSDSQLRQIRVGSPLPGSMYRLSEGAEAPDDDGFRGVCANRDRISGLCRVKAFQGVSVTCGNAQKQTLTLGFATR